MNRRAFERHLRDSGCVLHHHGGSHDVWINTKTLRRASVPRHAVIKRGTIRAICRQLGIPLPAGL